jgi:hypothetical protein
MACWRVCRIPRSRAGLCSYLIAAIEHEAQAASIATLWLYTNTAERVYARCAWRTVETVLHNGKPFALMRRDLHCEHYAIKHEAMDRFETRKSAPDNRPGPEPKTD